MAFPELRKLAVSSVCFLIAFLAYGSQILFHYLEPGPLTTRQSWIFNCLVGSIWWSYQRTCRVDPGRLPRHLKEKLNDELKESPAQRWCKKCDAVKPPRAHHCKQCGRYKNPTFRIHDIELTIHPDAFQKWTITVLGPLNASPTLLSLISSASSSLDAPPSLSSTTTSTSAAMPSTNSATSPRTSGPL